ncbi:hypothetical protein SAMN04487926_12424 [Paraburkholderia steynii]|uniref:Uncharacterized protein n=1 Tax=Paraburkholderia steynii TaxID=1245441 RepID=A0A7Z7FK88_9BURK|nr:hypothetical protein SAMN04487926_12424 [Paraburkholderia steynii]
MTLTHTRMESRATWPDGQFTRAQRFHVPFALYTDDFCRRSSSL